mmetsp:Transcript_12557/g.29493  ORF Transcript_12557/g.29493 Transcript_12557/m.29493 type:complete len:80 (-) Transcript_12557:112-351(-)
MDGMDDAQKKMFLAARGAKNLSEVVSGLRGKKVDFAKEVAMAYKLKAAGRYDEAPLSVGAIIKKEFPDGQMTKPFASTI